MSAYVVGHVRHGGNPDACYSDGRPFWITAVYDGLWTQHEPHLLGGFIHPVPHSGWVGLYDWSERAIAEGRGALLRQWYEGKANGIAPPREVRPEDWESR